MLNKVMSIFLCSIRNVLLIPVGLIRYICDLCDFVSKNHDNYMGKRVPINGLIPLITDRYKTDGGALDRHYFLQDIYVASKIIGHQPPKHYDVGSRVDGFVSHLLAGLNGEITIIDIRPLPISVDKLNFIQADATNLDDIEDNSIDSLSSLHAVEHFGLGRYGDPIDPTACFKAMKSLQRVTSIGGLLYFSIPIGRKDAVYFNSHRMFTPNTVVKFFDKMDLMEFSYIHDYKIITYVGDEARYCIKKHKIPISDYDCGIFVFKKK